MATPHSSTPSLRPQSNFPPIRYSARHVAVMVRIATRTSADLKKLSTRTNTTRAHLRLIATGRCRPTPAVLAYLHLQRDGKEFVWQPR